MLCHTAAIAVVNTVYRLALHLQAILRSLEDIPEHGAFLLIKAAAAGLLFFLRGMTFYDNRILAAAILRIVNTAGYITV